MKFQVKDVPGAGNCLFEAVGRSVGTDASELRQMVVQWLTKPNQTLHGEQVAMWIQNGSDIPLDANNPVASYVDHMSRQGTWGGGIELAVLSTLLQRPIVVFACDSNPNNATRVAEFLPDVAPDTLAQLPAVCVLYVGRAHYMQLVPL